jgi:hypothetical protein
MLRLTSISRCTPSSSALQKPRQKVMLMGTDAKSSSVIVNLSSSQLKPGKQV